MKHQPPNTYHQAKLAAGKAYLKYIEARDLAQSLHNHTWEKRVSWALYCPECGETKDLRIKKDVLK